MPLATDALIGDHFARELAERLDAFVPPPGSTRSPTWARSATPRMPPPSTAAATGTSPWGSRWTPWRPGVPARDRLRLRAVRAEADRRDVGTANLEVVGRLLAGHPDPL